MLSAAVGQALAKQGVTVNVNSAQLVADIVAALRPLPEGGLMSLTLVDLVPVPKVKAAAESAARTFVQAALPAAVLSWEASGHSLDKAALLTVVGAGVSAGLAAVARLIKPLSTDKPGAHVA